MKNVAILGSTGSIGINALKVIEAFPKHFKVVGLSSFSNISLLEKQIIKFNPSYVTVVNPKKSEKLDRSLGKRSLEVLSGEEGLNIIASHSKVDILIIAISGAAAIYPLLAGIEAKKHICLANKESIVMAGSIVMERVKKQGLPLIPVDSEHSAIFQCINSSRTTDVSQLFLTGSGGSLHKTSKSHFSAIRLDQVLKHPKWKMGKKITVDSATLMNKGLEIIEAHHLFNVPIDRIKLLIHPEAVIHSMCEFVDGSVIAQLGITDMKLPIQFALTYPDRRETPFERLDFTNIKSFSFEQPNIMKYPCLSLAMAAAKIGGTATAVLNAVDEIAVEAFLNGKIGFLKIPAIIEKVLLNHRYVESPTLDQIFESDKWAREESARFI